jgi:hypothetical protein
VELIAQGVAFEFGQPPVAAVGRGGCFFAIFVSVPEAAVDEDGGPVFGEDDVGADDASAQGVVDVFGDGDFDVQSETVAEAVEQGADDEFGVGVFAADAAHVPTAAGFGEAVFVHCIGCQKRQLSWTTAGWARSIFSHRFTRKKVQKLTKGTKFKFQIPTPEISTPHPSPPHEPRIQLDAIGASYRLYS